MMLTINTNDKEIVKVTKPGFHYSWCIMAITFLTLLIAAGIRSTPGVLIVPLEEYFGWSRTQISFALAVNLTLYGLCGPFAAAMIELYGIRRIASMALMLLSIGTFLSSWMQKPWHMILIWGLIVGIGTGFTSSVLGSIVATRWFVKHKGLVVGIFSASGATGQLVFLPLFAKLLEIKGWQLVVQVTAVGAFFIMFLVTIFMRSRPEDKGLLPYGATEVTAYVPQKVKNPFVIVFEGLKTAVQKKEFWLLAGSFFVCGASTNGLIGTHFISACIDHGITEMSAAGMLSVIGIFDIIGTTLSGWLSDRFDNRWLLFWYYGLRGLSLLLLPFVLGTSSVGLMIFIVFYGLDWVATVPPTVRLTNDTFGNQGGVVFGWILAAHQLGAATAAFGGGTMHTVLGSYQATFISAALLCLVASGLVVNIRRKKKKFSIN